MMDQDQADDARKELARLEKGGYSPAALDYLNARLLVNEGKWSQAVRRLEQARAALEAMPALDRDGESFLAQTNVYLGRCYEQLNDPGRQKAAYERLAARNPSSSAARLSLAAVHVAAGRIDEALDQYRQALAFPDAPPRVHVDLARLLIVRNIQRGGSDWTAVAEALDRAAKAQPDAPEVMLLRVQVLLVQNQIDEARQMVEEARERKPKQIEFHTALAGLCLRRNDPKAAAQVLKEAEQQAGDSVELRQAWAWYWSNNRGAKRVRSARRSRPRSGQIPARRPHPPAGRSVRGLTTASATARERSTCGINWPVNHYAATICACSLDWPNSPCKSATTN